MAVATSPSTASKRRRELVRFDAVERIAHWATALLVGVLIVTGAILYVPAFSELVGRRFLMAQIHSICGLSLFGPLLISLAGPWGRAIRRDLHRIGRLSYGEWRWLRTFGAAAVSLGKFNPGQKLNAVLVSSGLTVLLMSGFVLRFPGPFALSLRTGATFVHDWFALGIMLLVAGHIAFALAHRDSLIAMVTGKVSRGWARAHAPRWLAEHDREAGIDSAVVDAEATDPERPVEN